MPCLCAAGTASFFCPYGNSLLRLAYSYLQNFSDAEDILQDTAFPGQMAQISYQSAAQTITLRLSAGIEEAALLSLIRALL